MNVETTDRLMMAHCIDLSKSSGKVGEYPYAAVRVIAPGRRWDNLRSREIRTGRTRDTLRRVSRLPTFCRAGI